MQSERNRRTIRVLAVMSVGAIGGLGINAYRTFRDTGTVDATWFVGAGITLATALAIAAFVIRRSNSLDRK